MSIKIEINLHPEFGPVDQQFDEALTALGLQRKAPSLRQIAEAAHDEGFDVSVEMAPREKADEAPAPTRKRGEPSPGKTRRTKAEIAEDEAAEAADAQSNIRSGAEDRADPENADDAATQEADAADEQAEVASEELTIDDVKALAVEYQEKYGFEAVQEDGPKIFVEAVGKPPEGEPFWKFSILPTDQASLTKLATVWRKAIDLNPLKRKVV